MSLPSFLLLRILAVLNHRKDKIPVLQYDVESAELLGQLGPMPDSFAARWDPRDDWTHLDFGWIGEQADGIWTTVHPEAALLNWPDLWGVVAEFRVGGLREITARDWRRKSSFEFDAKKAMVGAWNRAQK